MRRRILFLISSLNAGGAERQLVNLASGLDPHRWDIRVLCTHDAGALGPELERDGIPVVSLGRGSQGMVSVLRALVAEARSFQPQVIHAYLVAPQFYALLARPLLPRSTLVLGFRSSIVDVQHYGVATRMLYRAVEVLGKRADAYIVNSHRGADLYAARGFDRRKMAVVPNGIRVEMFAPNPSKAAWARREFGCSASDRVVAVVATIEHMKGHEVFVDAAGAVASAAPSTRFVFIGRDSTPHGALIRRRVEACGLTDRFSFLGHRDDVADLLNGVDVVCLPSIGEGFPNVVAESMCMEVPCVVSDVGDAARIAAGTGWIVPPRDSGRLADAIVDALSLPCEERRERGRAARRRIVENFAVDEMVRQTERAYRAVIGESVEPLPTT